MTDEPESTEVWLRYGEAWFVDARALCKRFNAEYMNQTEDGDIYLGIPGRGEVWLAELLLDESSSTPRKTATLTPIK